MSERKARAFVQEAVDVFDAATLEDIERWYIEAMLARYAWNLREICAVSGIARSTIYRRIESYGLERPET